MKYCGYIDILGTKSLADHAIDDLRTQMEWFHNSLQDFFAEYHNGRCIAASDGAFYENENVDDFYPYYKRVRNFLFDKDVFFKCSYIPGSIGFRPRQIDSVDPNEKPRFLSLNFSNQSSQAYRAEARLKGIGCSVEGFGKSPKEKPNHTVSNFFLEKDGNKFRPIEFRDFAFSKFEVSGPDEEQPEWPGEQRLIEKIFFNISLTSMESDYIASKYIPLLINAIRSSDFENARASDRAWEEAPYVLKRIVSSRSPISGFTRLPGIRFVVLTLYDKIFSDNDDGIQEEAENRLVRFIARRKDCQTNLGAVPNFVLKPNAKKRLIRKLTEYRGISAGGL